MSDQAHTPGDAAPAAPSGLPKLAGESELWRRLREDQDPAAREELVNRYLPYATSLARRYRAAAEPSDDLIQVASVGLLNAVDRFDPARGIPFLGFAAPTILGELKRHFRDRVWTLRVPRGLHDRIAEVDKAIGELGTELQRAPSIREISERIGLDEVEVLEVFEAGQNRRTLSLEKPAGPEEGDDPRPADWVGSEDEGFELIEGRIALESALPHLSERERLVLRLRFVEDMTQSQIAERIGHSQMHVSRILRRTLASIREQIEEGESADPRDDAG